MREHRFERGRAESLAARTVPAHARIVASLFDERFSKISARISSRYENRES